MGENRESVHFCVICNERPKRPTESIWTHILWRAL